MAFIVGPVCVLVCVYTHGHSNVVHFYFLSPCSVDYQVFWGEVAAQQAITPWAEFLYKISDGKQKPVKKTNIVHTVITLLDFCFFHWKAAIFIPGGDGEKDIL